MGFRSWVSALFKSNKSSPGNNDTHPDAGTDFQTSSPHPEDTAGTTEDDLRSNLNASSRRDIDSTRDPGRRIAQAAARKQDCYGLKILVPQPSDRTGCVDIVAIHGLNGHREETWMHADTRLQWLSDSSCLPKDMPTARILTFGYNSKTYFSRSESEIPDFASELLWALKAQRTSEEEKQRRIVFICHSLGGLVFKQAVIMAHEKDRYYSCILDQIHGVVFFGTPHRGSSLAAWDEIGTLIVKASTLGYATNSKLSSSLKVDSKFLRRTSESFAARGEDFEVRSFYESVVEKESAILNWPKELPIASNANHSDICKFLSPEDSRYKAASLAIREVVGDLASGIDVPLDLLAMACLKELNSTYEHHLDQIDDPIAKTCEWVTSHKIWNLWDSVPGSALLWITADAGCGKSIAAKYLVDFFQKRTSRAYLHTHVCYFFFKEGLEHQDKAHSAVSAVLHQLFSKQHRLMHHAMVKYSSMPKSSFNCFSTLWSILLATMEDPHTKNVVWILDGLDECEEKSLDELIKALADFVQSRNAVSIKRRPACKIILLSRPLNSIERRFGLRSGNGCYNTGLQYTEESDTFRLSAEEESGSVAKDIAQFVTSKISDLGRQSELSADILHQLEQRLISSADYTFLWVSLVMNIVKEAEVDGISMGQIEAILATTRLEDVYEKLLSGRDPPRAFLRYVSRHWLDHYRPVREDLKLSYDYLLQPSTPQFNVWIISHSSWIPEEQRRVLEVGGVSIIKEDKEELGLPSSLPFQAANGRVQTLQADANIGPSEKKERELQAALQHFNLMGNEIDLYDEEYIHGKRYWKAKDYMGSGDASTSDEDEELDKDLKESKATIPDRMQYYRQQQSQRVVESIAEGRRATSASMANPTSSRSWLR
ncbi:ankyrin repeat protein [Colletotrichum abscissum]|uniref:ankyrin repeat protein n=1 Tax=Colletotrichum abscissum TaxID=1671311 RepID=UPI0027D75B8B|nr:ankyrin repeat protein [Colletotrichum abscissum]KAK1484968.1 ankyrin repeat protein [Colletotrichum abscissum]